MSIDECLQKIFIPWYRKNVRSEILFSDHPLYSFQLQPRYNFPIYEYIKYMFRCYRTDGQDVELLLVSMIYMKRLLQNIKQQNEFDCTFSSTNGITIFCICFLLASKYIMDDPINNKELRFVLFDIRIPLFAVNHLEIELLELIKYQLYISHEEYQSLLQQVN